MKFYRKHLFITSVIIVVLFFCMPRNYDWLFDNILSPANRYSDQITQLDPEERRVIRYGESYEFYMQLVSYFEKINKRDIVVLLPPGKYLEGLGFHFNVVTPAVFYYYTGYKAVWASSHGIEYANWAIVPNKKAIMLRPIHNKEDLDELLRIYKPFSYL